MSVSGRPINADPSSGFLLIDKPYGWTSFDVVAKLRGITGVRRIGHGGTLDPMATGLLVVGIGTATKQLSQFLGSSKEYEATLALGSLTDTYDAEGSVTPVSSRLPSPAELKKVLAQFRGEISQLPPAHSAIKVNGQKSYELARKGGAVALEPRTVTISKLILNRYDYPEVSLTVECSSGTYIRSLAHDLGQTLGVGAHLTSLKRTKIGELSIEDSLPMEGINQDNWTRKLLRS